MLVSKLRVVRDVDLDEWPFTVPAVRQLVVEGTTLERPITVLLGGNGSGKSTIIEAIAESFGIDVRGGHGNRRHGLADTSRSPLGEVLDLVRTSDGLDLAMRRQTPGFFLRAETAMGVLEFMTDNGVQGYGDKRAAVISHGEAYLQVLLGRLSGPGLYLLDEAEGPLSFLSTLTLLHKLLEVAREPATQVIYATHSPLVAAMPGAQIFELSDAGITEVEWQDTQMVSLWTSFLAAPGRFFAASDDRD